MRKFECDRCHAQQELKQEEAWDESDRRETVQDAWRQR